MLKYEDLNTNIYSDLLYIAHTHILAVSTITNTFIQQCTVLKEEEAENRNNNKGGLL